MSLSYTREQVLSTRFTYFRPGDPFSAFWTEVSLHVRLLTSVPEARFRRFGRKFHPMRACRLPSRRPVFGVLDGSFTPCELADFRPGGSFSAFGTEVSPHASLQTSVPEARFRRLGRKFLSLCACGLPSRRPLFRVWDGSRLCTNKKGICIFCSSQLIISSL